MTGYRRVRTGRSRAYQSEAPLKWRMSGRSSSIAARNWNGRQTRRVLATKVRTTFPTGRRRIRTSGENGNRDGSSPSGAITTRSTLGASAFASCETYWTSPPLDVVGQERDLHRHVRGLLELRDVLVRDHGPVVVLGHVGPRPAPGAPEVGVEVRGHRRGRRLRLVEVDDPADPLVLDEAEGLDRRDDRGQARRERLEQGEGAPLAPARHHVAVGDPVELGRHVAVDRAEEPDGLLDPEVARAGAGRLEPIPAARHHERGVGAEPVEMGEGLDQALGLLGLGHAPEKDQDRVVLGDVVVGAELPRAPLPGEKQAVSTPFGISATRDGSSPIVRRSASTVSETAVNRLTAGRPDEGAAFDGGREPVVALRGHPLAVLVEVRGVDRRDPVGERRGPGEERVVHPDRVVVVGVGQARDPGPVVEEPAHGELADQAPAPDRDVGARSANRPCTVTPLAFRLLDHAVRDVGDPEAVGVILGGADEQVHGITACRETRELETAGSGAGCSPDAAGRQVGTSSR